MTIVKVNLSQRVTLLRAGCLPDDMPRTGMFKAVSNESEITMTGKLTASQYEWTEERFGRVGLAANAVTAAPIAGTNMFNYTAIFKKQTS